MPWYDFFATNRFQLGLSALALAMLATNLAVAGEPSLNTNIKRAFIAALATEIGASIGKILDALEQQMENQQNANAPAHPTP